MRGFSIAPVDLDEPLFVSPSAVTGRYWVVHAIKNNLTIRVFRLAMSTTWAGLALVHVLVANR